MCTWLSLSVRLCMGVCEPVSVKACASMIIDVIISLSMCKGIHGSAWEFVSTHGTVLECESVWVRVGDCMSVSVYICVFEFVTVYMWQCECVSLYVFWCVCEWVWVIWGVGMYLSVWMCIIVGDCDCKFSGCEAVSLWVCGSECVVMWVCDAVSVLFYMWLCELWKRRCVTEYECYQCWANVNVLQCQCVTKCECLRDLL